MGATDGGESPGDGREEKIFVSVRLRPLNGREVARNDVSDWECVSDNTIIYKNTNISVSERSMYPSAYTFDRVFSCDCSTREVYKEGAKEVALSVVSGINSSIFAYGQTSSGKTYTMTGITEYTIADIYDYIQKHTEREFLVKFSAMEIYNESVRDLLSSDTAPLRLLDDPERGTVVEKLTEGTVRDWNHILELLSICEAQRQIGETSLNETSSRSHQIIRLTIESSAREFLSKGSSSTLVASVNFVDLAGSERASQSLTAGTRLKEGCHINRSLLTLGTVIRKLSKGRNGHIPFRDSKLTRILQSSLGGTARTAIICTMSPARSHVEQSRNTLLFASCAKEVCTNAQVNIVMTDKALVKQLQRELVRLESELKSPGSTNMTSHFAAVLREKDLQIEKLEKEVKDLILQRDIAQSQVRDLLRVVEDNEISLTRLGSGDYPHFRVQRSPDSEILMPETSIPADPRSFEDSVNTFGSTQYSNGHSDSSYEENYIQVSELQEAFMQSSPSPRLLISTSQFTISDSCSVWEDVEEERSNGTSEDQCKEVRCIETELSTNRYIEVGPRVLLQPKETMAISEMAVLVNVESPYPNSTSPRLKYGGEMVKTSLEEAREEVGPPMKEDTELGLKSSLDQAREEVGPPMKEDIKIAVKSSFEEALEEAREEVDPPMNEDREIVSTPYIENGELIYTDQPVITSPETPLGNLLSSSRSLKLQKSRSCKASLLISIPSMMSEKFEKNENTPPNGTEQEFTGRPRSLPRKISMFDYNVDLQTLSKKCSCTTVGVAANIEPEVLKNTSADEDIATVTKLKAETKERAETDVNTQVADSTEKDTEVKLHEPMKAVKDVGLDPIEEYFRSPSSWSLEFKTLQRQIVELWHTCNVSLVHRTYFFLLFKGDPTDSIYMEVELRRLSFLKSTFAQGNTNHKVEESRTPAPASSLKALRREREVLSKKMQKKLSEDERESLFLRWGISLSSKYRRYQLACRIWTKTDEMEHISDSAVVVAKVVGINELGQAPPKEMFGFSFPPRPSKRSYSFKRSMIPLL